MEKIINSYWNKYISIKSISLKAFKDAKFRLCEELLLIKEIEFC